MLFLSLNVKKSVSFTGFRKLTDYTFKQCDKLEFADSFTLLNFSIHLMKVLLLKRYLFLNREHIFQHSVMP